MHIQRTYANQLFNLTPVLILHDLQSKVNFVLSTSNINNSAFSQDNLEVSQMNCSDSLCIGDVRSNNAECFDVLSEHNHTYSQIYSEVYCNLGPVNDHTYSLGIQYENKEVDNGASGNGHTSTLINDRSLNDTIDLQHLTSLPEHFRLLGHDDTSYLSKSNREGNQCSTEVPICSSVSDEEVSMRENLRIASQFPTNCDKDVMSAYIKDIGLLPTEVCISCKHILFPTETICCNFDNELVERINIDEDSTLCRKCYNQLRDKQIPKVSYVQNKLDAGQVPIELQKLFVVEKRLISLIPVFLTLIVLPGGQFAQHGIAVNIPINMNEQLSMLPASSCRNSSVLISFARPNKEPVILPVRLPILLRALVWLKENNHLYTDIDISDMQTMAAASEIGVEETSGLTDTIEEEFSLTVKNSSASADLRSESNETSVCSIPLATQKPVNIKDHPFGEEKAFPWLFPTGNNGLGTNRNVPLTNLSYFHSRLYHKDPRWRCDIPYVVSSLNLHEWSLLTSHISCYMRTQKPLSGESRNFVPVNAEDLNNVRTDPALMQNSYMFTKQIRGTAAYWKSALLRLLAMVKTLGPPTFFVTLSCNDNWPELQAFIELNHTSEQRASVKDNPLMASLAFQQRWHALLKHVLKKKQPLGRVLDFFARVEFQSRGSPLMHVFLWTDLGTDFGCAHAHDIINVIDTTISTTIPDKDSNPDMHRLVNTFQIHKHSFTCKKGNRRCRFDFPRRTSSRTKLCFNPDVITRHRGRFYETVRQTDDIWVNPYNPVILKHWRANMDIQLVGNAESCAFYVCKYVCKAEPEELRDTLSALFANPNFNSLGLRKRLIMIGTCVLKKRKISAQEAMYRLGGLKLYESSRSILNINTLPKLKRFKLVKPKSQREHLPANCTDEHALFESNIIDYYRARPLELEYTSLHEFASWYSRQSHDVSRETRAMLPRIRLQAPYSHIVFRKRNIPLIVKPCKIKQTSDDYYYSCLLLYFPHRTESNLLIPYSTYRISFIANFKNLDKSYETIHSISCELEEAFRRIHLINVHEDIYPELYESANGTYQLNDYSVLEHVERDTAGIPNNCTIQSNEQEFDISDELSWHSLTAWSSTETSLENRLACLSSDQKVFFSIIRRHFQHSTNEKLHMFCTGGAGTGKSFLLRAIVDWLCLCHAIQPGCSSVVVTAPTGVAARNVMGHTLHSIFRQPVQHGYEPDFHELPAYALKNYVPCFGLFTQ